MEGLLAENVVYNADPLKETITSYLGSGPVRNVSITASNADLCQPERFN